MESESDYDGDEIRENLVIEAPDEMFYNERVYVLASRLSIEIVRGLVANCDPGKLTPLSIDTGGVADSSFKIAEKVVMSSFGVERGKKK